MVLTQNSTHFSCLFFNVFTIPSEECFEDTIGEDVVQEGDIDNEA